MPSQGWDFEATPGTFVYAVAAGDLTSSVGSDYGPCLELKFIYRGATYYAFYARLGSVLVATPCCVLEGACIAVTGRSYNASNLSSDQSHLHFEIRTKNHVTTGLAGRIDPRDLFGYQSFSCNVGDV